MSRDLPTPERDLMRRLDDAVPPHSHDLPDETGPADPMVRAARRLAQAPDISLTGAALDRIEARLRARVVELHPPGKPVSAPSPPGALPARHIVGRGLGAAWRYAAAACLIVVMVAAGAVSASADSLPGDWLYPVKQAVEDGRLALASDSAEPGLRVEFAGRRLDEFAALLDRGQVYTPALIEAGEHLGRALDLLAEGHGQPATLEPRIVDLTGQQADLIAQAMPLAPPDDQERLQAAAVDNAALQARLEPADAPQQPVVPATTDTPQPTLTPTVTLTASPSPTVTPSPSPTATSTPSPPATRPPSLTPAPTASQTPRPSRTPAPVQSNRITPDAAAPADQSPQTPARASPSRTPPGHGPTPGLGSAPPGQGGANPGIGNEGQPPGQPDNPKPDQNQSPPGQGKPNK